MKALTSIVAAILALSSMSAAAQTQESGRRMIEPERIEFNPHWFMQAQGGFGYTVGESNTFKDLASPAAALNFGYQFNPLFALRVGASGWQGKGVWVSPREKYKFNYLQGSVDAMLSLSNLFCGWNPKRTLDFYAFIGAGGNFAFRNGEAIAINDQGYDMQKLWRNRRWSIAGRGGLGMNVRLSDYVALNLEANANMLPDNFNSKRGGNVDWQFNGLVGLTIKFGKSYKKIPAVYEDIPAPAPAPKPEPKPEPKPAPAPAAPAPVLEPMTQDIFFLINSSKIRTSEQAKIDQLVQYMKANPKTKVTITGYADKQTGTNAYNLALSKRRSAAVAKAIEAAGIDASRVSVDAKGDSVQPFNQQVENRVAIAIAKE